MSRNDKGTYFKRHLSDWLLTFLTKGMGKALIDAFKINELDIRLRGDYVNAYAVGNSLAKIERVRQSARLSLSRKYLKGIELPDQVKPRERLPAQVAKKPRANVTIALNKNSIDAYVRALPSIKANAQKYAKPEARWEERCIRANIGGCPQEVLDRQIAKGDLTKTLAAGRKRRGAIRLDVLTVLAEPDRGVVAVELKRDLDGRIQHVARQLIKYLEFLDPNGEGLSEEIAASYQQAAGQSRALGLSAPSAKAISAGVPVYGLIGLANYNPRSKLLERAKKNAGSLPRNLYYCFINEGSDQELPPRTEWCRLE
jgi:hypothetical protein